MRTGPRLRWKTRLMIIFTALSALPAVASAGEAEQQFKDAYYQQTHEHDYAAAAAAYAKVVADSGAPESLRSEAKTRLAQCEEDQISENLAQLMPPDAVLYAQISRPGVHAAQILEKIGLLRGPNAAPSPSDITPTPLPGGLTLPGDFAISPALLRDLQQMKGAAVAITSVDPRGIPHGVAVVHPGDFDLLRGAIETGLQVLPQAEQIAGFRVYQVQGQVWIAATNRLFIVSDSRDTVAQTVARLQNPQADSLGKQPQFQRLASQTKNDLAFVYVDGRKALQIASQRLRGQEAMMARMFLDLEHLQSISAGLGATDQGIQAHATVVLAEGHRNIAYGLIRTAPLSKRSLANVPAGAAAVIVLGLNPADRASREIDGQTSGLTAMDIGREVFSNVEEISLFAMPAERAEGPRGLPEVGMIAAVKDPAKSEALWDQLLSLAAMFGPQVAEPPKETEIEGHKAKEYHFQGAPPIIVVRVADRAIAAGTRCAVAAAIRAEGPYALTGDPQFKPLLDGLKPESSKAVLVHAGRVVATAASAMPRGGDEAQQMAALLGDLRVMLVTNEKPNELSIDASVSGLPNVPAIVQAAAQMNNRGRRPRVSVQTLPPPPRITERPTPARQVEEKTVAAPRVEGKAEAPQKP
jgi:Protein of unknown function (DUF3352)